MEYKNGSWWTKENTTVMLQELSPSLFCLLALVDSAFQLVYDLKHKDKWQYAFEEVPELLEGWKPETVGLTRAMETKQFVTATGGIETVVTPKETRKRRKGAEVINGTNP